MNKISLFTKQKHCWQKWYINSWYLSKKFSNIIFLNNKSNEIFLIIFLSLSLYSIVYFSISFSLTLNLGLMPINKLIVWSFLKPTLGLFKIIISFLFSLLSFFLSSIDWYKFKLLWAISFGFLLFWLISLLSIINNWFKFIFDFLWPVSPPHIESSQVVKLDNVWEHRRKLIIELALFNLFSSIKSSKKSTILSPIFSFNFFISSSLSIFIFSFNMLLLLLFCSSFLDIFWGVFSLIIGVSFISCFFSSFISGFTPNFFFNWSRFLIKKCISEFCIKSPVDACGYFPKIYGFIFPSQFSYKGVSKELNASIYCCSKVKYNRIVRSLSSYSAFMKYKIKKSTNSCLILILPFWEL